MVYRITASLVNNELERIQKEALRSLFSRSSLQRAPFDYRSGHVEFVANEVTLGLGFLQVLQFPLPILIPPIAPHSSSSIIRGWYNTSNSGRRTKCTRSHPTHELENNRFTQNCWVFGLYPSSGILETRKHNFPEIESVSETSCSLFSRIPHDGKFQTPSNSELYTPLSGPFRILPSYCSTLNIVACRQVAKYE
jgi:hypothetical protein